jgi:NAD(P)-dependent dehydrogenase (short-subunit alcohol dehydrogenase family)
MAPKFGPPIPPQMGHRLPMKSAALELGVHKITVNAVVPGPLTRSLDTGSAMRKPLTIDSGCNRPLYWKPSENDTQRKVAARRSVDQARRLRQRLCSSRPMKPTW